MQLQGNTFILRGWLPNDSAFLQRQADNSNISRFLFDTFPYPYTINDAEQFIAGHLNQNPATTFAITINGAIAGGIEFKPGADVYRKSASLGYWLGESFWGCGVMTAAVGLITSYIFDNFDIVRIQATVKDNNPASMRVLTKAGFIKESVRQFALFKNGILMDEHVYALLK
ncbi:GNAT family N-acetyltransferase [Mucilaginibacter polytrichastri]|uniref:Putative ribosomal-protein-alanine acetyltransferase n=1 Tax=Mucilaginibacter polytrichastri TaxID=1302689 RepID=A0A1Q5ZUD1_9SPHI|nr:GNAT family protein [Mucilaginibacter polytrichastri]OKS85366.1 Putative ribosomal-protein-alanine acetyltransferase [Mucilaginibacter polytrichastri]SFS40037.1 Protein N-acetyltransferase, RimJ/RimL family [Mucilaginibacter polytrichastri]